MRWCFCFSSLITLHATLHSKKFPVAWYWKLSNEIRCFSEYLQEHYTRCITRAALFFLNVPGTFFNATHQVKAIAIGVSEANPLVEIDWLLSVYIYTCSFPIYRKKDTIIYSPIPTFIWLSISDFAINRGLLLHVLFFCSKLTMTMVL